MSQLPDIAQKLIDSKVSQRIQSLMAVSGRFFSSLLLCLFLFFIFYSLKKDFLLNNKN